ncbi:hypothetical protein [Nocardia sp. SC052]|uniref:hypothetical protein n=1 Tax=Nocardia sichangensis TaxID=3385975 RepID=UPI0039A2B7EF
MPSITIRSPREALDRAARAQIAATLTRRVMDIEAGGSAHPAALDITWLMFDDWAEGGVTIAGEFISTANSFGPILVQIGVPKGSLDDAKREAIAATVWETIAPHKRDGTPQPLDIWSQIQEIDEGNWAAGGQVVRLRDIVQIATGRLILHPPATGTASAPAESAS